VRDFVRQAQSVALSLLAVRDVLEDEEHPMGMVPRLRNFPSIQIEHTAAEPRKIILDFETFDGLVFREDLLHQMAKRRYIPLMLAKFRNAPPMSLRLGNPEYRQKSLARSHYRHVAFEHDQGIADRVDDTLDQVPVALAFTPGSALLADILDSEQNGTVMVARAKNFAGIDQHCALANDGKIMLDFEPFDRCTMRDHALEQGA